MKAASVIGIALFLLATACKPSPPPPPPEISMIEMAEAFEKAGITIKHVEELEDGFDLGELRKAVHVSGPDLDLFVVRPSDASSYDSYRAATDTPWGERDAPPGTVLEARPFVIAVYAAPDLEKLKAALDGLGTN